MEILMNTSRRFAAVACVAVGTVAALTGCTALSAGDEPTATTAPAAEVAGQNTLDIPRLSAVTAATAAEAAIAQCAADGLGFVSVAVVDRNGQLQAFIRGDGAAEHTIEAAQQKAYTAAAFGSDTSDLVERADENDLHRLPGMLFMPGGVSVQLDEASIAGIGVGGAPSGMDDQTCAASGLAAIEGEVDT